MGSGPQWVMVQCEAFGDGWDPPLPGSPAPSQVEEWPAGAVVVRDVHQTIAGAACIGKRASTATPQRLQAVPSPRSAASVALIYCG